MWLTHTHTHCSLGMPKIWKIVQDPQRKKRKLVSKQTYAHVRLWKTSVLKPPPDKLFPVCLSMTTRTAWKINISTATKNTDFNLFTVRGLASRTSTFFKHLKSRCFVVMPGEENDHETRYEATATLIHFSIIVVKKAFWKKNYGRPVRILALYQKWSQSIRTRLKTLITWLFTCTGHARNSVDRNQIVYSAAGCSGTENATNEEQQLRYLRTGISSVGHVTKTKGSKCAHAHQFPKV